MKYTGGCLCGSVRYECAATPVIEGICHCRDCQKASGSAYAPTFFVPEDALTVSGEVKYFSSPGKSGKLVSRGFCPNCGSHLFGKPEILQGVIGIRAGALDDPAAFHPKVNIFIWTRKSCSETRSRIPRQRNEHYSSEKQRPRLPIRSLCHFKSIAYHNDVHRKSHLYPCFRPQ